jgi:hypothetical protein
MCVRLRTCLERGSPPHAPMRGGVPLPLDPLPPALRPGTPTRCSGPPRRTSRPPSPRSWSRRPRSGATGRADERMRLCQCILCLAVGLLEQATQVSRWHAWQAACMVLSCLLAGVQGRRRDGGQTPQGGRAGRRQRRLEGPGQGRWRRGGRSARGGGGTARGYVRLRYLLSPHTCGLRGPRAGCCMLSQHVR